jgi:protein phosphatase
LTNIGRRRNTNEDHFLVVELTRQLTVRSASSPELIPRSSTAGQGQLMVVADGMGGHAGGGIASGVAVSTVARCALATLPWLAGEAHQQEVGQALAQALQTCQRQLEQTDGPPRMGTTLTVAYVCWPRLFIAHAGDSRCYLFRQGDLQQLTRDHTLAQKLVEERRMPAEEAATSPLRDVLWNAVGGGCEVLAPEIRSLELMKGDSLLLCTDGLTKHVSDRAIAALLADQTNASPTCERLIEVANAGGGTDNVTVIVARC